jgi:hypothetical protein
MEKSGKYIRWQAIRINQLGFINNLILGLSLGLLAYNFNFIIPDEIQLNCFQKLLFWISIILNVTSVFIALILAINRLEDFRLTAQISRKEEKNQTDNIKFDRAKSNKLGKKTWCLFTWQIATFLIGFLTSAIYILIELFNKLT